MPSNWSRVKQCPSVLLKRKFAFPFYLAKGIETHSRRCHLLESAQEPMRPGRDCLGFGFAFHGLCLFILFFPCDTRVCLGACDRIGNESEINKKPNSSAPDGKSSNGRAYQWTTRHKGRLNQKRCSQWIQPCPSLAFTSTWNGEALCVNVFFRYAKAIGQVATATN